MSRREREFTAYVAERQVWLRRVAYLLCGDWHRADDLVQATVTQLFVKWRQARAADNVDAYVRTMLVRVYLGEQRGGWMARVRVTADVPDGAVGARDVEAAIDVRAALGAVPPRQRAALVLRYYCDLTNEQAAEVLGCSAGTVKSQTSRGLVALRRAMAVEA
ncbi:SigE family RNA polymerase sigma factor [Actinomadura macrotermitis]|uniref:RNA polymerase sigma-E factor n=1 Tax=Actinomadura macrotermitis TaxID=2585200 RepID=A0A7K0BW92_9ACTN|nr:SigE family RNA polymerase sigma factor [Actinomadura macrotermitis]MQY05438.1 RNA polymerase sigma-E factor [Actinomadura macrotermitis]